LLYLQGGHINGHTVLPAAWTKLPQLETGTDDQFGYSHGWWIPKGARELQDYAAIGVYGQYIYVNPAQGTVVVKFSDHGAEQDEFLTMQTLRAISAHYALVP
jgi:CubicO group peptidase (beta-lactamase class C family)